MQLLTIGEVAERLAVSTFTVRRMVAAGKFPPPITLQTSIRWSPAAVDEWIRDRGAGPQCERNATAYADGVRPASDRMMRPTEEPNR